ncbi:HK97 family phage prohead protease [Riemerella columbina]|uniref:HK97 family phage prohead protease n=1 Tax=Riemerella columbina TaxID=103810 RepID=UPI00036BEF4B|nr:HK97 family phage prohead protease [Riemerella columbina]
MSKKQTFLVSDESENSHGFKVLTEGIDTTQFEKNPIMLYMHERPTIIGRWENLRKEDNKLYADAIFDTESEKGKEVARQVEQEFLRGASLGITYQKEDLKNSVLEKCQLYEISIVDIGSNPNALKLYDNTEIISLYFENMTAQNIVAHALVSEDRSFTGIAEQIGLLRSEFKYLLDFKKEVDEDRAIEIEALLDIAVGRKVIPEHLKELQKKDFEKDFYQAKKNLITAIFGTYPLKTFSPIQEIEKTRRALANKSGKSKIDWGLEEYRKFAPDELEKDKELYQRLVDEAYKEKHTII